MIKSLRYNITGAVTVILLVANTLFWACFLYPVVALKLIFPFRAARRFFNFVLDRIAQTWIRCNNAGLWLTRRITWRVFGTENLSTKKWYLVISNHQSWTDIVVLQKVLNGKTPFIKFFLKKELIWVPILGLAWWGLDFPFMKRYTASFLAKNPHLKGKDIEITKKACAKFRDLPVSIMNFVEGTRYTEAKSRKQNSPYRNLLKPKSGGVGFVFSTMGEYLTSVLNVTIAYPDGPYSFWDFLCGRVNDIMVHVEELPVTDDLKGDYINDPAHRDGFQRWLNGLWEDKDIRIDLMLDREDGRGMGVSSRRRDTKPEAYDLN